MTPVVHFLRLHRVPILRQLRLEEALLRTDGCNWCVVNSDVPHPTAVLGISAKLNDVVDVSLASQHGIEIVRRFSGGGTVLIDRNSLLVTLVFQKSLLPKVPAYPRTIMKWTESLYSPVFGPKGAFQLKDNDYTFGDLKFGGNAQSIVKDRWLHHTSFLWDIDRRMMASLKQPQKQPEYRQNRDHEAFLCTLRERFESKDVFFQSVQKALKQQGFTLQISDREIEDFSHLDHVKTTTVIPTETGNS